MIVKLVSDCPLEIAIFCRAFSIALFWYILSLIVEVMAATPSEVTVVAAFTIPVLINKTVINIKLSLENLVIIIT